MTKPINEMIVNPARTRCYLTECRHVYRYPHPLARTGTLVLCTTCGQETFLIAPYGVPTQKRPMTSEDKQAQAVLF